jgi:hypothetical protein
MITLLIMISGVAAYLGAWIVGEISRWKLRAETERAMRAASYHMLRVQQAELMRGSVFGLEPAAPKSLEPWTPAEREAFGVNDTERFLAEVDAILDPKPQPVRAPLHSEATAALDQVTADELLGMANDDVERYQPRVQANSAWYVETMRAR